LEILKEPDKVWLKVLLRLRTINNPATVSEISRFLKNHPDSRHPRMGRPESVRNMLEIDVLKGCATKTRVGKRNVEYEITLRGRKVLYKHKIIPKGNW
jgi:hypothetical protein